MQSRIIKKSGPVRCLQCGHEFGLGAPEPSWCPDCGKLCSAFDGLHEIQAAPIETSEFEECPLTQGERARWRAWFWVFLLLGPMLVLVARPLAAAASPVLPSELRSLLHSMGPMLWMALPVVCAVGSAFCLARSRLTRPTSRQMVAFVGLGTIGLILVQVLLLVLGFAFAVAVLR